MSHSEEEISQLLDALIASWENEVVEFKRASDGFSTHEIGKYFSALANEANLRDRNCAWLVFGIDDKTRTAVGTDYRHQSERLQGLKRQIAQDTEPSITFREIRETRKGGQRVLLFQIPASPRGMPIAWKGHYYAREHESLGALGVDKLDEIRAQSHNIDWSAEPVPEAGLSDLDESAVNRAREGFAEKYANRFSAKSIHDWPIATFLDRAKLAVGGQVTRTCLLLLGKEESAHLLLPHPAQMTWKLVGAERAYEHFGPPFLLSSSKLYRRIRNIQMRILPDNDLLRREVSKYDQKIVLEALHNCIAHQDYQENSRILVIEHPDRLVFESAGAFFEGSPEDYVLGEKTPRRYRNTWLAQAMAELGMIDTMGYGIHDMFEGQRRRFFPLPDYELDAPGLVKLTVYGQIIDPAYSRLLIQETDLPLSLIRSLDRVQKGLTVDSESLKLLRREKLVEGRKNNLRVAASVAELTSNKADYIRKRGLEDEHYEHLILSYLEKFRQASRRDIDDLILDKLSDGLSPQQKRNKVHNLLTKLRRREIIRNAGSRGAPRWTLVKPEEF